MTQGSCRSFYELYSGKFLLELYDSVFFEAVCGNIRCSLEIILTEIIRYSAVVALKNNMAFCKKTKHYDVVFSKEWEFLEDGVHCKLNNETLHNIVFSQLSIAKTRDVPEFWQAE